MDTYTTVKNRILQLLGERNMSIHRLAMESAVAPSSIKNILPTRTPTKKDVEQAAKTVKSITNFRVVF